MRDVHNILIRANGSYVTEIACDTGKPATLDQPIAPTPENIIRELNRAKCAFQLRTIELILRNG